MTNDDILDVEIIDSTSSAQTDVPRGGHHIMGVVVGAAAMIVVAVAVFAALHDEGLSDGRSTGVASVPVGAPGSMLSYEQVPSWRPSTSATVAGGFASSLTRDQVPSWSPTAANHGQSYREQVPAGS